MTRPDKEKAPPHNGANSRSARTSRRVTISGEVADRQGLDTDRILRFLIALHGNRSGYVGLGVRRGESFRTRLFFWCPIRSEDQHGAEIVNWLSSHGPGHGLYYTPAMFDYPHALRTNISQLRAVWVDCDSADSSNRADSLPLPATLTILTSPSKTQRLWLITGQGVAPETAAGVNLRLAQLTSGDSCWQSNHYLRLPWTHNRKYEPPPLVRIIGRTRRYTVDEITTAFPPAELPTGFDADDPEVHALLRIWSDGTVGSSATWRCTAGGSRAATGPTASGAWSRTLLALGYRKEKDSRWLFW